jgi:uncharacterized protein
VKVGERDPQRADTRAATADIIGASCARTMDRRVKRKRCDGRNGIGCYLLGTLYETGEGVPQNKATARELYGKACSLGANEACSRK